MKPAFRPDGVSIDLEPLEAGFVFRAINDRIHSLPESEVESRLGISFEAAQRLLDDWLTAETEARKSGQHWLPPRP